jgi:hypothetical protein
MIATALSRELKPDARLLRIPSDAELFEARKGGG